MDFQGHNFQILFKGILHIVLVQDAKNSGAHGQRDAVDVIGGAIDNVIIKILLDVI